MPKSQNRCCSLKLKTLLNLITLLGLMAVLCLPPVSADLLHAGHRAAGESTMFMAGDLSASAYDDNSNRQATGSMTPDDDGQAGFGSCVHGHGACAVSALPILIITSAAEYGIASAIIHHNPHLSLETPPPRLPR